jgi:hypothetical protein
MLLHDSSKLYAATTIAYTYTKMFRGFDLSTPWLASCASSLHVLSISNNSWAAPNSCHTLSTYPLTTEQRSYRKNILTIVISLLDGEKVRDQLVVCEQGTHLLAMRTTILLLVGLSPAFVFGTMTSGKSSGYLL